MPARRMWRATAVSIAVHAVLAAPLLLVLQGPPLHSRELLALDVLGVVSRRQQAALTSQMPPLPAVRPRVANVARAPAPHDDASPVAAPAEPAATPSEPVAPAVGTGAVERAAEKLAAPVVPPDVMRRYLAAVRSRLKAHLVLPADAGEAGHEGVPVLGFRIEESGAIRPGSLHLARSSGFPELDSAALRSAESSTPFEAPPRELDVQVALTYEARHP